MRNAFGSPTLMMAALAAVTLLAAAACKPEPSTAYNPQLDGLVYQQPAQPDLSLLGDQKTLHPASMIRTAAPAAAPTMSAPDASSPATAPAPESAPAGTQSAPAGPAPAAPTTDAVTAPPG